MSFLFPVFSVSVSIAVTIPIAVSITIMFTIAIILAIFAITIVITIFLLLKIQAINYCTKIRQLIVFSQFIYQRKLRFPGIIRTTYINR